MVKKSVMPLFETVAPFWNKYPRNCENDKEPLLVTHYFLLVTYLCSFSWEKMIIKRPLSEFFDVEKYLSITII